MCDPAALHLSSRWNSNNNLCLWGGCVLSCLKSIFDTNITQYIKIIDSVYISRIWRWEGLMNVWISTVEWILLSFPRLPTSIHPQMNNGLNLLNSGFRCLNKHPSRRAPTIWRSTKKRFIIKLFVLCVVILRVYGLKKYLTSNQVIN